MATTITGTSGIEFVVTHDKLPQGSVLNVIQTHVKDTSDQELIAQTRANITDLTATITPKYNTSNIMVEVRWSGEFSHSDSQNTVFGIRRDGIDIGNPNQSELRATGITTLSIGYHSSDNFSTPEVCSYSYFDSPATTSATTYTATIMSNASSTLYNNMTVGDINTGQVERLTSSITLTEHQGDRT